MSDEKKLDEVAKDDKGEEGLGNEKEESQLLTTLSIVTDNLETYQGRDTLLALLHYWALIVADMCVVVNWSGTGNEMGERFLNMFLQLNNCRVMLRLFDDFGAIREYYRFHKANDMKVFSICIV